MKSAIKHFCGQKVWPYQVFTCLALAFMSGIFVAGFFELDWQISQPVFILSILMLLSSALVNLVLGSRQLVLASWLLIFVLLGSADFVYQRGRICKENPREKLTELTGPILSNPIQDFKRQQAIIETVIAGCSAKQRVLINLPHFPNYRYGDIVRLKGELMRPGMIEDFDYEKYLRPKYVSYILQSPAEIEIIGKDASFKTGPLSLLFSIKSEIETTLAKTIREPEAALGIGILTGAKASIPQGLKDDLNAAGLTHIIALSGFNITIIIAAIALVVAGHTSRRNVFLMGSLFSMAFIVMTGASASVVRAGIFSIILLYSKTIGRKSHQTNILLLTAFLMLAFNPFLLRDDMGFQLSFLAFAGLIYLARPISFIIERSMLSGLPDWIKSPFTETLAAQIAVFPLIAFAFGRISLIAPVSNVLVLGIIPLTMLLVFLTAIGGLVLPLIGNLIGVLAWALLAYINSIAGFSAKIPLASINAPKYSIAMIAMLYGFLTLALYFVTKRMKRRRSNEKFH